MSDAPVKLLVVRPGRRIVWPFATDGHPLRGLTGTVVPADDPLINCKDESGMLLDQRHHLKAADPGAAVTPHGSVKARRVYEEIGYGGVPYIASPDASRARRAQPKRAEKLPTGDDPRVGLSGDDLAVPAVSKADTAPARAPAPPSVSVSPGGKGGSGGGKGK